MQRNMSASPTSSHVELGEDQILGGSDVMLHRDVEEIHSNGVGRTSDESTSGEESIAWQAVDEDWEDGPLPLGLSTTDPYAVCVNYE